MAIEISDAGAVADDGRGQHWPNGWCRRATTVKSGDVIAEIETDKATMEFEAVDEGTVGRLHGCRRHRRRRRERADHDAGVADGEAVPAATARCERCGLRCARYQQACSRPKQRIPSGSVNAAASQAAAPPSVPAPGSTDRCSQHVDGLPGRRYVAPEGGGWARPRSQTDPARGSCATRWRRRCAATTAVFVMGEEVANIRARIKSRKACLE